LRCIPSDAFYGSDEWRSGPRETVLALIDSHASVVLQTRRCRSTGAAPQHLSSASTPFFLRIIIQAHRLRQNCRHVATHR
jgi:hypothetical protein